jgi:hypothetical protein
MSPTLREAMNMAERGKQMAAEVRELHQEEEPEQLELFEGLAITQYRGSLAAGGFIKLDEAFKPDARVTITCEAHVSKVTMVTKKGRRQHVFVIDADTVKITKA